MRLEETVMTLEGASINAEILGAHQIAGSALRNVHSNMSIDQVDKVADDLQEQMDLAAEIGDAIAQPMGQAAGFDEVSVGLVARAGLENENRSVASRPLLVGTYPAAFVGITTGVSPSCKMDGSRAVAG